MSYLLRHLVAMSYVVHMHNIEGPIGSGQAAEILDVSIRRVQQLIESGALKATKLPGRTGSYVLDVAAVRKLRAERADAAAS